MSNVGNRFLLISSFRDIINFDNYLIHFDIGDKLHFFVELKIEEIHNQFVIDYILYLVRYAEIKYGYIHCNMKEIHHVDV
jgi:hypothetical protein